MSTDRIIVGIDVGSSKVCALIADVSDANQLEIIGVGVVASRGMKKGLVVNTDDVVESIQAAAQRAEQQSGFKIVSAFVGISGAHISTQASEGVVAVRHPDHQIAAEDVQRAIDAARLGSLPSDREIVQAMSRQYMIDNEDGIRNPIGMLGRRLKVETTIVSGSMTAVNNLVRCVERAVIGIDQLALQVVAAGDAVLSDAEQDLGVALIDLGGGTTDIGIFEGGALIHGVVLPIGGFQVTNDIAIGLRVPFATAEEIKVRHGFAMPELIEEDRDIEIPAYDMRDERTVSRKEISEIIAARMEETFELVQEHLGRVGYTSLPAGIVLCGGTAQLAGLRRLAGEMFHCPVRIGAPAGFIGLADQVSTPAFASSIGLLRWGAMQEFETEDERPGPTFAHLGNLLSNWLRNFLP